MSSSTSFPSPSVLSSLFADDFGVSVASPAANRLHRLITDHGCSFERVVAALEAFAAAHYSAGDVMTEVDEEAAKWVEANLTQREREEEVEEREEGGGDVGNDELEAKVSQGTEVYNVLLDVPKVEWDSSQERLVVSHCRPSLLPTAESLQSALRQRFQGVVNRLRRHSAVAWWADRRPDTRRRVAIAAVECALGQQGAQNVLGILRREVASGAWRLEDLHQTSPLEIEKAVFQPSFFMEGNIVVVRGRLLPSGVFQAVEVSHPPREEGDDTEAATDADQFGGKLSRLDKLHLMEVEDLAAQRGLRRVWVMAGECRLDDPHCLERISKLLRLFADPSSASSLPLPTVVVFFGSFTSRPLGNSPLEVETYRRSFDRLADLLRKFPRVLRNTHVVLVPGPNDPGIRCLPRLPLGRHLSNDISHSLELEGGRVHMASNPTRIRQLSQEVVCVRYDYTPLLAGESNLHSPLLDKHHPQPEEMRQQFPPFLAGQAHLLPVAPHGVERSRVAWDFDFALGLNPMPDAVFVADSFCPAYAGKWAECWISNPGRIERGEFVVFEAASHTVEVCCLPTDEEKEDEEEGRKR